MIEQEDDPTDVPINRENDKKLSINWETARVSS